MARIKYLIVMIEISYREFKWSCHEFDSVRQRFLVVLTDEIFDNNDLCASYPLSGVLDQLLICFLYSHAFFLP